MNADRITALAVAVLCVAALGASATTLQSSLDTKPDEVIDVQYKNLPVGKEVVDAAKERAVKHPTETVASAPSDQGDPNRAQANDESHAQSGANQQQTTQSGSGEEKRQPSLLERLLALLLAVLRILLLLAVLVALAAVAYRYRDRIAALFEDGDDDPEVTVDAVRSRTWGDVDPSNPVYSAWIEVVSRAGVASPETKTPDECAESAVESGLERSAVETVRDAFVAVRYGGADPEDLSGRVRDEMRTIRGDGMREVRGDGG